MPLRSVPRATTLEVATTVIRPTPEATLRGKPSATLRNGTRNTPPPSPSVEPRPPAAAPAAMTTATIPPVISGNEPRVERGRGHAHGVYDGPVYPRILVNVPALLRRRPRAELVSR